MAKRKSWTQTAEGRKKLSQQAKAAWKRRRKGQAVSEIINKAKDVAEARLEDARLHRELTQLEMAKETTIPAASVYSFSAFVDQFEQAVRTRTSGALDSEEGHDIEKFYIFAKAQLLAFGTYFK